jgi:RNA polymerase sigma-70 factor (ECF subfamily)
MMQGVAMERADDLSSEQSAERSADRSAERRPGGAAGQTLEAAFQAHRALLFHIAYRMLGTVSDAEDIVQEAWIRWQRGDVATVEAPKAYLAQVVTRLSIDRLREARRTREEYVGPWLPEPLLTEPADGADVAALRSETLRTGFLVMLERLGPVERAVFVLREAFDYDYAEIAGIVGKSEAACRQILARARRHMADDRPRFTDRADNERIAMSFLSALATGDIDQIERLLAEDAVLYSDGGGKAAAARNPIYGANKIARFFAGIRPKLPADLQARPVYINGEPGVILMADGQLYGTWVVECAEGRIRAVHGVRNPDKLAHLR